MRRVLICLPLTLLACSSDSGDVGEMCDTTSDCLDGLDCVGGACAASVVTCDPACGAGQVCVEGACIDAQWQCLGQVPAPQIDPGAPMRRWQERYLTLGTFMPVPDLRVTLCRSQDVDCTNPVASDLAPDAAGFVSAQVPNGFQGFAVLTSTIVEDSVVHVSQPIVADIAPAAIGTFFLFPQGQIAAVASSFGIPLSPDRGSLVGIGLDCTGRPAAGLLLTTSSLDAMTAVIYVDAMSMPDPALRATGISGIGFLLNHPSGTTTIRFNRDTSEQTGQRTIPFRPGVVNYLALPPTP